MSPHLFRPLAALASALVVAGLAQAQLGTLTTVSGTVSDLSLDSSGDLLYCTLEGELGTITTGGVVTELADSVSGPFPFELRGVLENAAGEIAVIDEHGDIYELTGGLTPATQVYADLYLIQDVTDFMGDASGNYVIASATPSSGVRGMNWVNSTGGRWAYYLVKHSPIALAADPIAGGLLMADDSGGGKLRRIDATDGSHPTSILDEITLPGFLDNNLDGDLVAETDGSTWMIAGGDVWRYDRGSGISSLMATGLSQLRGAAIAASSGGVPSASGWSLYLAEGAGPTTIRELGNVGAPAPALAPGLGTVPNRGTQHLFFSGQQVHDMAVDNDGNLLVGGDDFGAGFRVIRIGLPAMSQTIIAKQSDGLTARIEGIEVDREGIIWALGANGKIHRVQESPLLVTVHFDDPLNDIVVGKDLAMDRDGTFFVADRAGWDWGQLEMIDPALNLTTITNTEETRGVMGDPFTGDVVIAEWNGTGFEGTVGVADPDTGTITDFPGLSGMNYTNASTWGDGDVVQDVLGNVYTISEDDWSLYRYNRFTQKKYRIGSSYLNHPSGLAIAKSSAPLGGETGWSLYVAEYNWLYEISNVPAPAPRILDRAAPPAGRAVGFLPGTAGTARAVLPGRTGQFLHITTSTSQLFKMTLATGFKVQVAGPVKGLAGDLVGMVASPTNTLLIANRAGTIFEVDTEDAYSVTTFFDNAGGILSDVRSLTLDGNGNLIVLDRPAGEVGGRLYRLSGGALTLLAYTNRGLGTAIDPLTGDIFVTQQGTASDGGGEILRVDAFASPAKYGHYRGDDFFLFDYEELDGGIAFDDAGNFYVSSQRTGRIVKIDRATGTRSDVAGNYDEPASIALSPGRAGLTGPLGTSLFVMDEYTLWEVPVDGLPAPAPPAAPPGLAPPAEFTVQGVLAPGATTPMFLDVPAEANRPYLIFPSVTGKVPGVPMGVFGDLSDLRVIRNNYSFLWNKITKPAIFPGWIGVFDGSGQSPVNLGFTLPNDPTLLDLDVFMDVTWISYAFGNPNGVATVGGTAQLYLGE